MTEGSEQSSCKIFEAGIWHISVRFCDVQCFTKDKVAKVAEFIRNIQIKARNRMTLSFLIECFPLESDISDLVNKLSPNICILPNGSSKISTFEFFTRFTASISDECVTHFGISDIEDEDFQWIIENCKHLNNFFDFFHYTGINLPDIKSRQIELAHSRGINALCTIPQNIMDQIESTKYMESIADSYARHPLTIFTKFFLQIGVTVFFPLDFTDDFIIENIAPLCHPFTSRRTFFSAVDIKRFVISSEHVEQFLEMSEASEAKADEYWKNYATFQPPGRLLFDCQPQGGSLK